MPMMLRNERTAFVELAWDDFNAGFGTHTLTPTFDGRILHRRFRGHVHG